MVRIRIIILSLSLVALSLTVGCKSKEEEVYEKAYEANYAASYQEGLKAGEERARKEGTEAGEAGAREAAETGTAWELYKPLVLCSLALGVAAGLALQYIVLLNCRRTQRLPQFSTVASVPAMKRSHAYSLFERRRHLVDEVEERLIQIGVRERLQAAEFRLVHDALVQQIRAASSIGELSMARLTEFADEEFTKIVAAAREKAERLGVD